MSTYISIHPRFYLSKLSSREHPPPNVLRDGSHQMSPPSPQKLTWFLRPIRFGPGGFVGDLMLWGLPPFSATFPTLITADIMVLTEDKSEPSKPMGELDVIGTRV